MNAKTLGILAVVGIGGYLLYRWQKTKVAAAVAAPPTTYQESLAVKYQVPVETVARLIEAIPVSDWGPPPEVIAEKILAQR